MRNRISNVLVFSISGLIASGVIAGSVVDETMEISPTDGQQSDNFGDAVAISGNTAIVSISQFSDNPTYGVYVFDVSTGAQRFKLRPESAAPTDRVGGAIAISDGIAIIKGRDVDLINKDVVYVFDTSTGEQLRTLRPVGVTSPIARVSSVAIHGDTAIVGIVIREASETDPS